MLVTRLKCVSEDSNIIIKENLLEKKIRLHSFDKIFVSIKKKFHHNRSKKKLQKLLVLERSKESKAPYAFF